MSTLDMDAPELRKAFGRFVTGSPSSRPQGIGGVPFVARCSASVACRKWSTFDAGDHVIFPGRVLEYRHEEKSPLVFFGGDYLEMTGHQLR